jgi:hypothetical protein
MTNGSLLGYLAFRFSDHPENIATEALGHILTRSSSARRCYLRSYTSDSVHCWTRLSNTTFWPVNWLWAKHMALISTAESHS